MIVSFNFRYGYLAIVVRSVSISFKDGYRGRQAPTSNRPNPPRWDRHGFDLMHFRNGSFPPLLIPCRAKLMCVTLNIYNRCRVTRLSSSFSNQKRIPKQESDFRLMVASDLRECAANKMDRFLHEPMTANRSRSDIFDGVGEVVAIKHSISDRYLSPSARPDGKMNCIRP